MTFKERLNQFEKSEFCDDLYKIVVAKEVECQFADLTLTEDDFEIICDFVYDWLLGSEANASEICRWVYCGLKNSEFTIKDMQTDVDRVSCICENYM